MYKITEIFTSIQGEGFHTGTWVNFIRFAGCNLDCEFCDTDFSCRMELEEREIIERLDPRAPIVVLTGGEPTLQVTSEFVQALHNSGHIVHMETNGTQVMSPSIDWVTVSPKKEPRSAWHGFKPIDEIKWLVPMWSPRDVNRKIADHHFIQPIDDKNFENNLALCLEYLKEHPWLRLSVQLHKLLDLQ